LLLVGGEFNFRANRLPLAMVVIIFELRLPHCLVYFGALE